jgi:hypothetical protein
LSDFARTKQVGFLLPVGNQIGNRFPLLGNDNGLAFFDSVQEILSLVPESVVIDFNAHAYSLIGKSKDH